MAVGGQTQMAAIGQIPLAADRFRWNVPRSIGRQYCRACLSSVRLVALVIGFSDGALMIADDQAYKETPEMLGEILDGNQVEKSLLGATTNLWAAVGQFSGDHRTNHTATHRAALSRLLRIGGARRVSARR